jgi:hypothetical protein
MVDPALGVLEYAKRKHKDLRGALTAAKEVLDRAKPEGEGLRCGGHAVISASHPLRPNVIHNMRRRGASALERIQPRSKHDRIAATVSEESLP